MENIIKEYSQKKESTYFDRKSARIAPKDIIKHIVAFSNASGGKLAIGIEDNGEVTGFLKQGAQLAEAYERIILENVQPFPKYTVERLSIPDTEGDFVLIIDVQPSHNKVIYTKNKKCYLRIGDSSVELNHDQITKLEYDKGQRQFEDELVPKTSIKDIDEEIMNTYKKHRGCEEVSTKQILQARGFMEDDQLTNAGLLLFGKNIFKYLPHSRVRFLRYDGTKTETGKRMNLIKEFDFEGAIPYLIEKVTSSIKTQLRDFQYLHEDGKFKTLPEYPEFSWFEGIVNALTHRDYSYSGDYVRVEMFDDRLEIFSPGELPNIVSLENMRQTRYSRNPRIARTLTEFGWVRELNEGVNRIYDEMESFFLKEPLYSEPEGNSVLLVLENNIISRQLRNIDKADDYADKIGALLPDEKKIIAYLFSADRINVKEVSLLLEKSSGYSRKVLNKLREEEVLVWNGTAPKDPTQYYTLNPRYVE